MTRFGAAAILSSDELPSTEMSLVGAHCGRITLVFYRMRVFTKARGYSGSVQLWYNSYTRMRFDFNAQKSKRLRTNPKRGIGFEEAQEIFKHPYYLDQRSDMPEQYRA